ncbi:MAG TPA: hypothetical protein DDW54_03480 [Clostridiales bacterium]|nr:hypothetical protein [Clostridiales bacterium]
MKYEIMIKMLFLFLSRGKLSAKYLAGRFDISVRTVMRYLDCISLAVPLIAESGRNGGYYIADSFKFPAAFMTEEEFNAVISTLDSYNSQLSSEVLSSATDKLKAIKDPSSPAADIKAGNFVIDGSSWNGESNGGAVLSLVEKCIESSTALEIAYVDKSGETTKREIEPQVIILKQGLWYVYAYCRLRKEFRTFKISRISYATKTASKYVRRTTDVASLSFEDWSGDVAYEFIDLEIKESAKAEVEEWLGVSSVYRNGGRLFASAKLPYDGGLIAKLLGFGNSVRILSPAKLKRDVLNVAKKLVAEYEKND